MKMYIASVQKREIEREGGKEKISPCIEYYRNLPSTNNNSVLLHLYDYSLDLIKGREPFSWMYTQI